MPSMSTATSQRCVRAVALAFPVLAAAVVLVGCSVCPKSVNAVPPIEHRAVSDEPAPVAIIGDSYTSGTEFGGLGDANWTAIMARNAAAAGIPLRLTVSGKGGSGYVEKGGEGTTFLSEAQRIVTPDDQVVVVFGSRNDGDADVTAAAETTFDVIRRKAPNATVIAIAPFPTTGETNEYNSTVPTYLLRMASELRVAADRKNVTFIDPVRDEWFAERPDLVGADTWHPTDAGHRHMADMITPAVLAAIRE